MEGNSLHRPHHQRNPTSKTGILKSFVSPHKSQPLATEAPDGVVGYHTRTKSVPILPPDHPHGAKSRVLGERQSNAQSPSCSSARVGQAGHPVLVKSPMKPAKSKKRDDVKQEAKSIKPSGNLASMFAKVNRSSKNLSTAALQSEKENTTPPASAGTSVETPIWAQFATTNVSASRPSTSDSKSSASIHDLIAKYTPQEYTPAQQRNFNGTLNQPNLRPTLASSRPQSVYSVLGSDGIVNAIARRVSGGRMSIDGWRSEDGGSIRRTSTDQRGILSRRNKDRRTSGSSMEQAPSNEKLNVTKRGGRVMAAVAALQGKTKDTTTRNSEQPLDEKTVNKEFEAVLDARNIPEPMRQKMRTLTLRVKADFVRQDHGQSKNVDDSPTENRNTDASMSKSSIKEKETSTEVPRSKDENDKSSKRSRPRSRTFTFSKGDKKGEGSPSKKQRSQSKSRPNSIHIPKEGVALPPTNSTPTTPTGSLGRKSAPPAVPADYIAYLRNNQDPTKVEVGRLHKLRILLRHETVAWVDSFVALGGMTEIINLLKRTMAVEWREEHEDQLLHENLLCLKGICTTARAMTELDKIADDIFPALLGMIFDEEKKGPAEYTTRGIIMNILFNFLASATNSTPADLENRARRILTYLGEPPKPEAHNTIDFVLGMRVPRPYKAWCREVTHVTREVFWIFLHHLNVVPLPKPSSSDGHPSSATNNSTECNTDSAERHKVLSTTYTTRHFPGSRPPVPAAPYIGGVEWDATTYIATHLDLLNGIVASITTASARNELRQALQASGFEKVMGETLRTCKEKFYSGVHDGLRAWAAAAVEDGWETKYVREGPTEEEVAERVMKYQRASPKKSPKKKGDEAPKLDALPLLDHATLDLNVKHATVNDSNDDDGWLE